MAHPNEDLLRKGYDAFSRGDIETMRAEILHEDVVLHVSGRNQTAGDYHGVDEVLGFFGKLMELSAGTFRVELHDAIANDQHAIALSFFTGQRNGKTLDRAPGNEIYHVNNGRVQEAWFGVQDPYEADEFWT